MNSNSKYKLLVSVLLGLMAFSAVFYSLEFDFHTIQINIFWGHVFFMLVTLAWGARYGFISLTLGLVFVYPFLVWQYNGAANIVPLILLYLWVWLQDGSTDKKIYLRQGIFAVITVITYITIFPMLYWINSMMLDGTYVTSVNPGLIGNVIFKTVINEFIIIAVCDALLLVPIIRRFFRLPIAPAALNNGKIILGVVGISVLFASVIVVTIYRIIFHYDDFSWLFTNEQVVLITVTMQIAFGIIGGGIAARFYQSRLQAEDSLQEAYNQIKIFNEQLEQRVEERTEELQYALKDLESYVCTVSHDLKAPIRAIEGYCQLILEDYSEQIPQDAKEMVDNISTISEEMLLLMRKLLEYDKYSKKSLDKKTVVIENMIKEIVKELRLTYNKQAVQLVFAKSLPPVWADPVLLRMALANMLSNAIKFSNEREVSIITIDVSEVVSNEVVSEREKYGSTEIDNSEVAKELVFSISDNGVGFEAEYTDKLFLLFQRLHSSKEYEGSGIGLATVKKIIQRHSGKVWIEGQLNQGVTVYFTLQKKSG